ncbi:MAG: exodeoxyribonuclease VII small subunit [Akkermansiaceae bacterium]|nr:exodeoxyribonuclease VII small subunit [Akkermansiaceae bacterium]NNM30670.1 exodeoxyribonuclease VII small subunit [Akkermansiaceae bacterium]
MPRKPAPKPAARPGSGEDLSFEEALQKLESLVDAMENDQLPLEELVAHYERGAGLLQHCETTLAAARKRIELIKLTPPEEKGLESGGEPAEASGPAGDAAGDEGDDIRLL